MIGYLPIVLVQLAHLILAVAAVALAWMAARRPQAAGLAHWAVPAPLLLTAGWAMSQAGLGTRHPVTLLFASLGHLGWLWLLYRLFPVDTYNRGQRVVRPLVMALALVEMLQLGLIAAMIGFRGEPQIDDIVLRFGATLRLLFAVGALFLVHNLYVSASSPTRAAVRWPASALGLMWLYDLNAATIVYLDGSPADVLVSLRAVAMLAVVALIGLGFAQPAGLARFRPSRTFAFSSMSLLAIGTYLLAMLLFARVPRWVGSDVAWMVQAGLVVMAGAAALLVLPSRRLRGSVRVLLAKHLFQHRYDYRAEWMRFTATMGKEGHETLHRRIVQAVADITDSPGGALLLPGDGNGMDLATFVQWDKQDMPAVHLGAETVQFLEHRQFIIDFDELRCGEGDGLPGAIVPTALLQHRDAWAIVPLMHYDRLVGAVLLLRPQVPRRLDWEDFDLLRVVGRQLASYLAEQAGQTALGEAQKFDEFNRRMAFVMHDIKNLTSQLSLLSRNAERHADNPAFRADMLVTLRNSAEKLEALLARLGRYRSQGGETPAAVDVTQLLAGIAARYAGSHQVIVTNRNVTRVFIKADALEQAIGHLVQNAVEASDDTAPVLLDMDVTDDVLAIAIVDSGAGMSPEFVLTDLFRPFQSTKPAGFGIGAYEARELVRTMGGRLQVESREGLGTRFTITIPLAAAPCPAHDMIETKVA